MLNRGNRLKFTVVLAMTALALTGFAPARSGHGGGGHGGRGGHSYGHGHSSGGGCSSSHQDHDGSSSSHDDDSSSSTSGSSYGSSGSSYGDDTYGSSSSTSGGSTRRPRTRQPTPRGSSSGGGLQDGTVRLVSCATPSRPYATVEVSNGNSRSARFLVSVTFVDSDGLGITDEVDEVRVSARDKKTVRLEISGEGLAASVDHCNVDPRASVDH